MGGGGGQPIASSRRRPRPLALERRAFLVQPVQRPHRLIVGGLAAPHPRLQLFALARQRIGPFRKAGFPVGRPPRRRLRRSRFAIVVVQGAEQLLQVPPSTMSSTLSVGCPIWFRVCSRACTCR